MIPKAWIFKTQPDVFLAMIFFPSSISIPTFHSFLSPPSLHLTCNFPFTFPFLSSIHHHMSSVFHIALSPFVILLFPSSLYSYTLSAYRLNFSSLSLTITLPFNPSFSLSPSISALPLPPHISAAVSSPPSHLRPSTLY